MKQQNSGVSFIVGLVVLFIFGAAINHWLSGSDKKVQAKENAVSYSAQVTNTSVTDPATLEVAFTVKNTGSTSGTPDCTILAHNDSYAYQGTAEATSPKPIKPGDSSGGSASVVVTHQGAQYANQVSVSCKNS